MIGIVVAVALAAAVLALTELFELPRAVGVVAAILVVLAGLPIGRRPGGRGD